MLVMAVYIYSSLFCVDFSLIFLLRFVSERGIIIMDVWLLFILRVVIVSLSDLSCVCSSNDTDTDTDSRGGRNLQYRGVFHYTILHPLYE